MNKRGSGAAWAVAVLAILGLAGALVWAITLQQRVQELNQTVAESQQLAQMLTEQAKSQDEQVRQLQEKTAALEQTLSATATKPPEPEDAAPETGDAEKAGEDKNPMAAMFKMFEGEKGKKFAEASADAAMAMQYADLFSELGLPPETEQKVRNIIRDYMVRGMQAAGEFMSKDGVTPESAKKFEDDLEAQMRDELARVLTPEGMAIFDEYEEGAPERILRKSFDMQLGMFAPALAEETRTMVVDVMVEEMMGLDQEYGSLAGMAGPDAVRGQLEALDRGRQRLTTVLDEQQMAQVDGFIQQTRAGVEMFMNMMSQDNQSTQPKP